MPKKTADSFQLTIELGNAAMLTRRDVAAAIKNVAAAIRAKSATDGGILDQNGNKVGSWSFIG